MKWLANFSTSHFFCKNLTFSFVLHFAFDVSNDNHHFLKLFHRHEAEIKLPLNSQSTATLTTG